MSTTRTTENRLGFTLLELLVVMAIIGLLAGMLMPVLALAQEKARRVNCMNNLGQFGRALAIYAMDNDEFYPDTLIALAHEGYAPDPALYKCRSDRSRTTAGAISAITAETADEHCSYNLVLEDIHGARLSAAAMPTIVVACDKDGANGNVTEDSFGGNHAGDGGHVVRADGAVKWVAADDWSNNIWGEADLASVAGY